jgi:P pilus assembly chaperone PapD
MNYLLFGLEILLIMVAIGRVPARSGLRICRSRVIYNEPRQVNHPRS